MPPRNETGSLGCLSEAVRIFGPMLAALGLLGFGLANPESGLIAPGFVLLGPATIWAWANSS